MYDFTAITPVKLDGSSSRGFFQFSEFIWNMNQKITLWQ